MGKTADKDPAEGLEPDITTIEDEKARSEEQRQYYGGDPDDDDDLSDLDRGDNLDPEPTDEDRGDEIEEEDDESEDKSGQAEDEAEEDDVADDSEDPADPEEDLDSGDDSDADDGDAGEDDSGEVDDNVIEPEDDKDRDPGIPRHRFNEVNNRMKEAERRLAELEAADKAGDDAAEDKFDFDAAENEYMELLLDGKTDEATAKRREIRTAEQELFKSETKQETVQDINERQELADLSSLSTQAEEAYPVFNENAKEYDPVIANKVVVYMKGYLSEGQTVSDAFVSGLADVIEQYDLDQSDSGTEPEDTKPTEKKGKPIKKTKEMLAAAKKGAPSPAGHGEGSAARGVAVPSIEDMSDSDLDKLTPEQMSKIRGDFVE